MLPTRVKIEHVLALAFAASLTCAGLVSVAQPAPHVIGLSILAAAFLTVLATRLLSRRLQPVKAGSSEMTAAKPESSRRRRCK